MRLQQLIERYVAYRQALGKRFRSTANILRSFGRAVGAEADVAEVGAEQVNAFLRGSGLITNFWHAKHTALRGLYHYAISRGYATVSPLPSTVPKLPPRFVPHIYSREELRRLLKACRAGPRHTPPGRAAYCAGGLAPAVRSGAARQRGLEPESRGRRSARVSDHGSR